MVTVTQRTEPVDFIQITILNLFVINDVRIGGDLQVDGITTGIDLAIGATITSGTVGSVLFVDTGPVLAQDNTGLFWNNTDKRLGVGTSSPSVSMVVQESSNTINTTILAEQTNGVGGAGVIIEVRTAAGNNNPVLFRLQEVGIQLWDIGMATNDANRLKIGAGGISSNLGIIINVGGEVFLGPVVTLFTGFLIISRSSNWLIQMEQSAAASTSNIVGWNAILGTVSPTSRREAARAFSNFDDTSDATRTGRYRIQVADSASLLTRLVILGSNVGIGVPDGTAPARRLHIEEDDALNSAVTQLIRITHTTSGAPAIGIGVGLEFEVETAAGNNEVGATIEAVTTAVGAGVEDFDLVFSTMAAGAAAAERMRIASNGDVTLTGGLLSVGAAGNDWTTNQLILANAFVGNPNEIRVTNVENTNTNSHARLGATVGGASGGDAFVQLGISGVRAWGVGVDNSNSDVFVIGQDASNGQPGTNDALRITTATPPVISYNTTHPTGTFDYVCATCGRHQAEIFACCGSVEWHDDLEDFRDLVLGRPGALEYMEKVGVMERTFNNAGEPEVFTRLGPDWLFVGSMAYQNRERMDRYFADLDARLAALGG